jgi:hypothetical protein
MFFKMVECVYIPAILTPCSCDIDPPLEERFCFHDERVFCNNS